VKEDQAFYAGAGIGSIGTFKRRKQKENNEDRENIACVKNKLEALTKNK
jgi:hypothetical protein